MAKVRLKQAPSLAKVHTATMTKEDTSPIVPIELIYGSESPVDLADVTRPLAAAKRRRRPIRHLGFWGTRFHDGTRKVFKTLGKKLKKNRHQVVEELVVSGVPSMGNEELSSLAPFLNGNSTIRSLDITGASFDAEAIKEVKPFFKRNSSLEVLALGENRCVGDEGIKTTLSALQSGKGKLRVLAVEGCGLGGRGAASISRFMIRGGRSLRVLELSNNNIGDPGVETLVHGLKRHRLGHLALNNAGVGDVGAMALGELLKKNRSLHTLSLQKNEGITDVGASSLLKAVYNTDSIQTIISSNHVLKNLTLGGCSNIGRDLLKLSTQLSARSRLLSDTRDIVRLKIVNHLKGAERGLALQGFDLELMPHILSFVGKSNGMTSLFHTLKSMPLLYTQYDPRGAKTLDYSEGEEKEGGAQNMPFLEQLKLSSRRARQYYAIFASSVPKQCPMLRYQDRRIRNKHESSISATSNNSQSSSFATTTGGNASFVHLTSCFSVLERALLLWLFHTRRILKVSMRYVLKMIPRAFLLFLMCPQE